MHEAAKNAFVDKRGAVRFVALVIDGQGSSASGNGAVVNDRDQRRGYSLTDLVGKDARSLSNIVSFLAVSDCLMNQYAGPAVPQDDGEAAGRSRPRI